MRYRAAKDSASSRVAAALTALIPRPRPQHMAADFYFADINKGHKEFLQPESSYHFCPVSASFTANTHVKLRVHRSSLPMSSVTSIHGSGLKLAAKKVSECFKKLLLRPRERDLGVLQMAARTVMQAGAADARSESARLAIWVLQGETTCAHVEVRVQVQRHTPYTLTPSPRSFF